MICLRQIQTDALADRHAESAEHHLHDPDLLTFLSQAEPIMVKELLKNRQSRAFEGKKEFKKLV